MTSKSLPVTVKSGQATFKADLRLRVQCGAEADVLGVGAGAELGIYANIIEFVAVLDSTSTCALESTEWWDLNVGAFAQLDVVVDYKTLGAIPTVSTTLLSAPKATQCWLEIGGSPGSSTARTATAASPAETGYTQTLATGTVPAVTTGPSLSESGSSSPSSFKYPLTNSSSAVGGGGLVTSTVYTTTVYTVTSCAASVVNCPASYQQQILVTQTIDAYTTVCPASAAATAPGSSSSAAPSASSTSTGGATNAVMHIIIDVVALTPCASPIVETFVPGSTAPPPAVHQVTATVSTVAPWSSSSSSLPSSYSTSASPFIGAVAKAVQYSNGTATHSPSAYGSGKPSVSWSQTATPAPARTSVTAGAASKGAVRGLAVVAGSFVALLFL